MFAIFWQFAAFFAFWLLVSGSIDWQHLLFGSIVSAIITVFWRRSSERVLNKLSFKRMYLSIQAIAWLIRDVWFAAWQVVPIVLSPKLPISPTLVHVRTNLHTRRMRSLYANSITLTPGTLTVQLRENELVVHALTAQAAQDVLSWSFEERLKQLEEAE